MVTLVASNSFYFKRKFRGCSGFSHEKHYILSSELKQLYVAITRARQRLWIYDEDTEYSMPIRNYWKDLIKVETIEKEAAFSTSAIDREVEIIYSILSTLAKKSDSREWNQQGIDFFEQRRYEQVKLFLKYF